MKIKIEYKTDLEGIFATTKYKDNYIVGYSAIGAGLAKKQLIERIKKIQQLEKKIIDVPEIEEVEIDDN